MDKLITRRIIWLLSLCTFSLFLSLPAYAIPVDYTVETQAANEAKVYLSFNKNEGTDNLNYGFDAYGTYISGFPSLNDNGDVAGRSEFIYIDPNTGREVTRWEAAVWIRGDIHRFGVAGCSTSNCQSRATKLNNARDTIIGSSHSNFSGTTQYYERSMKWRVENNAWKTNLGILEYIVQSYAEDINESGNIVGSAIMNEDYVRHAQVVIGKTKYIIGSRGTQSLGMAINNLNVVVGSIRVGSEKYAFRWNKEMEVDSPEILKKLSGNYSIAYDINDAAVIVGAALNRDNKLRAVKWKKNSVVELGTLGGDNSVARSVNNSESIVGYANTTNGEKHGFLYSDGELYDLNDVVDIEIGWIVVDAYTINNPGQILVRAQKDKSTKPIDNAYWILSPDNIVLTSGAKLLSGNGYCQWGKNDCEITYPPLPANNAVYQLPSEKIPKLLPSQIPEADAYVCNWHCDDYYLFSPQFSTIDEAIRNTAINTKIVLLPGVYRESITLRSRHLIGVSREYTVINADGLNARGVSLQGRAGLHNVTVTGGNALNGGGIQVSGGGNIIDNCIIQGNTASRDGGGVHGLMYSSFELSNSVISQNKATYGGGYLSWPNSYANIKHNQFKDNEALYGAGVYISSYVNAFFSSNKVDGNKASINGGGIFVDAYTYDSYIRNTIVTNNYAGQYAGGIYRGALLGSVVYGNTAGIIDYSAAFNTSAQNAIIWGNSGTVANRGIYDSIVQGTMRRCSYCSNVLNSNPMFVDPENGDFRLQQYSPAIDSGGNTSNKYGQWQTDDFNGQKRGFDGDQNGVSVGGDYDMGVYEYISVM